MNESRVLIVYFNKESRTPSYLYWAAILYPFFLRRSKILRIRGQRRCGEGEKKEFVENARNSSGLSLLYRRNGSNLERISFLASSRANLPSPQIFETSTRSKHLYGYCNIAQRNVNEEEHVHFPITNICQIIQIYICCSIFFVPRRTGQNAA